MRPVLGAAVISATDIHTKLSSGHVVQLERDGKRWRLPAEVQYRKGEVARWGLYDVVWPGDRLLPPDLGYPTVLGMFVEGFGDIDGGSRDLWFLQRVSPGLFRGIIGVLTWVECPACTTTAAHPIDIPTDLSTIVRYTIRTCITCDTSWQQEAM